jgi:hypothetical protein
MIGHKPRIQQRTGANPVPVADIEKEIERIQTLGLVDVKNLWQRIFRKSVPKALSRDLLNRMLAWHIQEQAFGGHDRATLKILASYAKGAPDAPRTRRLKPGTEIVREYQGERHTVIITAEGFRWREGNYPSLTAIARIITGTNWNGPRFCGLRTAVESPVATAGPIAGYRNKRPQVGRDIGGGLTHE